MPKTSPHEVGDQIKILDTSNDRKIVGYIRNLKDNGEVFVYVQKWDTIFKFQANDKTGLGRFRLVGLRR